MMASAVSGSGGSGDLRARLGTFKAAGIVYATSLLIVGADIADGTLFHADIDDQLRELQIRLLMSGKAGWYDLTLPFVQTPEPYLSPWSRLVDLPYVVIARVFSLFLPAETALQVAFRIWPIAMLALFSLLAGFVAMRLVGKTQLSRSTQAVALAVMTMVMAIAVMEFSPGRIDHHNVQILTLLALAAGLIRWDAWGGLLVGVASALSVVIGLECLPFVVFAYAGIVGAYLIDCAGARGMMRAAGFGMFVTTVFSAVAFLGYPGLAATRCDAFSAPYIALLLGFSLILGLAGLPFSPRATMISRLLVLTAPALALLALVAVVFETCLAGPYAMIDPLSRTYWFDRIWQEHSVLYFYGKQQYDLILLLAISAIPLAAVLPAALERVRGRQLPWLCVHGLAIGALLLTLVLTRYIRFPAALAPLFIPAIVSWGCDARNPDRVRRTLLAVAVVCAVIFAAPALVVRPFPIAFDAVDYMAFDECKGQDLSVLDTVLPGRIAVPGGLSLPVLRAAPDGFSVAAIPFHRASAGMKRMYEAFLSPDPSVRREALAPFDYVAVCRFPLASDPAFAPLYAALSAGEDWPGLSRLETPVKTGFQLFRIDHAALR